MEKENLSILVIDPEITDHQRIRDSLYRSKLPAELNFATSTEAGFREIQKKKFDLILTDHSLPRANAFHLLFELQQDFPFMPVVLLTHDDGARVVREAFKRGVDDYLLKEELETISFFDVIGNIIEKKRKKAEEAAHEIRLREQAERDGLTGLFNHRYLLDAIEREFARAKRYRRSFSLLMLDLDGFKAINDACGHPQGDQVLLQISRLLIQTVRFVDIVARYGGDEFVIILPETEIREAAKLGERILKEIQKRPFLHEQKIFPLSASVGVAGYQTSQISAGTLLKQADQALYQAKRKGRARVVTLTTQSFFEKENPPIKMAVAGNKTY